jgi:predicted transcriptional regulator
MSADREDGVVVKKVAKLLGITEDACNTAH